MNNLNFVPFQNAKKEKIKSQFEHEVRTWLDKRGRHYIIVTGCQFRGDCSERENLRERGEVTYSIWSPASPCKLASDTDFKWL